MEGERQENRLWIASSSGGTYGDPWGLTGTPQTDFGFTGEPTGLGGLVYLRARYYNPSLGVFSGLDPFEGEMARAMSLNRYEYVQGSVVNQADPSGMCACPFGYMPLDKFTDCTKDCVPISEYLGNIYADTFNQVGCSFKQLSAVENYAADTVKKHLSTIPGMSNFTFIPPDDNKFNLELRATGKYADCLLKDRSITDLERLARLSDFVASAYPSDKDNYLRLMTRVILGVEPSGFAALSAALADHCSGWGRDRHDCPQHSKDDQQIRDEGFNPEYQDGHNQPYHFWASVASLGGSRGFNEWLAKLTVNFIGLQFIHEFVQGCICNVRAGTGLPIPGADPGGSWEDFKLTDAGLYFGTALAGGSIKPSQMGDKIRDVLGPSPSIVFGTMTASQLNYYFPLPRYRVNCGQNPG